MQMQTITLSNNICPNEETFIENAKITVTKSETTFSTEIEICAEKFEFLNDLHTVFMITFVTPTDQKKIKIAVDKYSMIFILSEKYLKVMHKNSVLKTDNLNAKNCVVVSVDEGDILIIIKEKFEFLRVTLDDLVGCPCFLEETEYEENNEKYNIGASTISISEFEIIVETKKNINEKITYIL